jgi:alkylation response protein AidB-like acyl-CoA dehydrogenase
MYFLPTADQTELQRGVREVLDRAFPIDKLAAGFDSVVWDTLVETGVFALRTDLELGLAEASLVFEELGRACVPGPLVGTFLTAGYADGPVTVLEADRTPLLVANLEIASSVLVLGDSAPAVAAASTDNATPVDGIDPLTTLHELTEAPVGTPTDLDPARVRLEGALLTAAIQVGLAARMTELAVTYAKTREQFDRPIGSFQAVKHILADMFVRTELARASLHSAAVMLDDRGVDGQSVGNAARAVAGAKQLADEAATTNARSCVQVHGGMGFTWEVPVHYFLKRAWLHATEFGTADEHAEDLANAL